MITQTIKVNLVPGGIPPRIDISQYDVGSRTIVCNLYNGSSTFTPPTGTTVCIRGTKPDKHGFEYEATLSGSAVTCDLTEQMSCVAGDVACEIVLTYDEQVLGTGNFVLDVEKSALDADTDISETELPDIIDAARSSAASAAASADAAQEAANSVSVEYTASGNPITLSAFPTEADVSMTIAPTQSLNGYDKPWAGGAGKNRWNVPYIRSKVSQYTYNGITYNLNADGTVDISAGTISASESIFPNAVPNVLTEAEISNSYNFNPDTTYTVSFGIPLSSTYHGQVFVKATSSSNWSVVANVSSGTEFNFTTLSSFDQYWVRLQILGNGTSVPAMTIKPMIRLASETDATFAPYSNICPITGITTATVQTTDGETTNTASMALGETVYAGSVNFNNGTGDKTMPSITLDGSDDEDWSIGGSATNPRFVLNNDLGIKNATSADAKINALSSYYKVLSANQTYLGNTGISTNSANSALLVIFDEERKDLTVAQWRTYLASNPLQVVYELATPATLTLTPATLTMLDGDQTVSGNGETVTISYDGDVKQYIDTKVPDAPTTDGTYTLTCVVSGGVPTYSWT